MKRNSKISPATRSNYHSLIIVQIARMRMLQAILGHQRRSLHTIRNQILSEVQNSLRHIRRPLVSRLGVLVTGPHQLSQCGSTRPHLTRNDGIVNLLRPQRRNSAFNMRGLGVGLVCGEVVIVDSLPGLVRCTPTTAVTLPVEVCQAVDGVWVDHYVVAGIVSNKASVAAVEVHKV